MLNRMVLRNVSQRQLILFIFSVFFLLGHCQELWAKGKKSYQISCKSVILSDATDLKRLYGKNIHKKVLPASTVKVMTALVALEKLSLNQYLTVRASATRVQPSKIDVKPGERYKVKDLIDAILIQSANDASIVLAEAVAGSEGNFVKLMNQRAKELGALHTKFANSNGLPTSQVKQYTTAYDMYLIFRQALQYEFFRDAIKQKYKTIYSKTGRKISLKNHNKILFTDWKKKIYGKTGYTKAAKSCFVGTVQNGKKTLIISIFGCSQRWEDIKYVVSHYGGVNL